MALRLFAGPGGEKAAAASAPMEAVPGEVIDGGVVETMKVSGDLHFTHKHGPDSIFCVDLPGKMV